MDPLVKELVQRLNKLYGDRLVSVVLYGSAAVGETADRYADRNVLCVLPRITPSELAAAEPVFRWWREQGHPAPLLLAEDEVSASADCFPIEFHDIRHHHLLLHGRDLVSGLSLDDRFYRAQVEHELRAKLFRLRQKAAGVLNDNDLLRRLLCDSVSTFCVLIRHVLRLGGHETAFAKRDVVRLAKQHLGLNPEPFYSLLDVREGKIKPRAVDPQGLFPKYLEEIQAVIHAVDRLER